ncbi:zinc knuckle family protein, partial [Trifolium pratense]
MFNNKASTSELTNLDPEANGLKGKKAYVLDIWLTSPQLTTQGGIMNHSWYLDSGCSRHMTGEKQLFSKLTLKEGGSVGFGGNQKGKIIGTVNTASINGKKYGLVIVDDYSRWTW